VTDRPRKLEAPHRRRESPPPRVVEKAAIVGYRSAAAALAFLPPALSRAAIGSASQLSYLAWPAKRRAVDANFGHILGLPPSDPRVRRLALRAYREYARYMVELMRLPSRPHEELVGAVEGDGIDRLAATWQESGRALIVCAGHMGNNEAVGAAIADRGYPVSVIADDSAFPELFELLRRQRESWGVRLIPWRNLRELFGVLKRGEVLALLVDWGYRADGIPVRLFDAWTTLPAGPATLAAKTGALLTLLAIHRTAEGRFRIEAHDAFVVPSSDPAELQRATQRLADALQGAIAAAPAQWYSFKPMWPEDAEEQRELERRAAAMLAGDPAAGQPAAVEPAAAGAPTGVPGGEGATVEPAGAGS
jgi:lauroyl/myristoyl acyltransferase